MEAWGCVCACVCLQNVLPEVLQRSSVPEDKLSTPVRKCNIITDFSSADCLIYSACQVALAKCPLYCLWATLHFFIQPALLIQFSLTASSFKSTATTGSETLPALIKSFTKIIPQVIRKCRHLQIIESAELTSDLNDLSHGSVDQL